MPKKFEIGLEQCEANYQPMTPLRLLERAAEVYPNRTAVIHGARSFTWSEHAQRCHRLARALIHAGIERGDTVAVIASNIPEMLEAQFGVPLSGAVLNCINVRLEPASMAFILQHSETRLLLVDQMFANAAREAIQLSGLQIDVVDIRGDDVPEAPRVGAMDYEEFLKNAPTETLLRYPQDEWDAISLNYTSGTTGNPKGVVFHHRGAYLNALGTVIYAGFGGPHIPVYLWTLPLFHCNGWCYAWAVAAVGGTHICLRKVVADEVFEAIAQHGVTYFCGAPTVLAMLAAGKPEHWHAPPQPITIACAGASPPLVVIKQMQALGFTVLHVYGMTEQHGVNTTCVPQESWESLPKEERLLQMGRQGVRTAVTDEMVVVEQNTYQPVVQDGQTIGEVLYRGNLGMKGYLKNPEATREAFAGGWYHTGDLAVVHDNGYIEIKDRSKDIIISGGENVSSLEIEEVLYSHPDVLNVAVVAVPDEKWGEVACAVVELKPGAAALTQDELIKFCRAKLAGFKTPRHVIFEPIVRTATGKLQKFMLRKRAAQIVAARQS